MASSHEMRAKRRWHEKHGVEEYYLVYPKRGDLQGHVRDEVGLAPVIPIDGFISPRLGIRFKTLPSRLITPDGRELGGSEADQPIVVG